MVLQRAPQQALIWGWAKQSTTVAISFNNQAYQASVNATSGAWSLSLPAMQAGGPYDIIAKSDDGSSQTLSNVLFGDVWICSGQSNMQFTVNFAFNASQSIADAQNYPNIRLFTVGQNTISPDPLSEFSTIEQSWVVTNSTSINGPGWGYFSATCWFFAKNMYDEFQIPLGLVSSNWGGTYIQAWSSPTALSKCTSEEFGDDVTFVDAPKLDARQPNPNQPSVLWNAMIVPLLPMRIVGVVWYQAEANVGADAYYACAFPVMITDWQQQFGYTSENFFFFFVQLAPYVNGGQPALPQMRIAQTAALALPNVGMAVTIDLGDPTSPEGMIHPRDKEAVGRRLSLAARAIMYGQDIQYTGPTFQSYQVTSQPPNVEATVTYVPSSIGKGLVLAGVDCPALIGTTYCGWPQIGTSDGLWTNATISDMSGNNIVFSATVASGVTVTGLAYGYNDWPIASIYNGNGLPAPPFIAGPPSSSVPRHITIQN